MKRRALVTTLLAAVSGCLTPFRNTSTPSPSPSPPPTHSNGAPNAATRVVEHRLQTDEQYPVLTGEVKNTSDDELSYMQLDARFYDGREPVGVATTSTANVDAEHIWQFVIRYTGADAEYVDGYEFIVRP
jgi:hypothetical protein